MKNIHQNVLIHLLKLINTLKINNKNNLNILMSNQI